MKKVSKLFNLREGNGIASCEQCIVGFGKTGKWTHMRQEIEFMIAHGIYTFHWCTQNKTSFFSCSDRQNVSAGGL